MTIVPPDLRDSMFISPLNSRAIDEEIDRPSPIPPVPLWDFFSQALGKILGCYFNHVFQKL